MPANVEISRSNELSRSLRERCKMFEFWPEGAYDACITPVLLTKRTDRKTSVAGKNNYGLWLLYVVVASCCVWFILFGWSDRPVEAVLWYVPGWVMTLIWASSLVVHPISLAPLDTPQYLRAPAYILLLISCLFFPVAYRAHPVAVVLTLILFFLERIWLVPRWKAGWDHKLQT
jgi:hypothetical protein